MIIVSCLFIAVASTPENQANYENIPGATSGEHESKSPIADKSFPVEQRSPISPSTSQHPAAAVLNGLISSEYKIRNNFAGLLTFHLAVVDLPIKHMFDTVLFLNWREATLYTLKCNFE